MIAEYAQESIDVHNPETKYGISRETFSKLASVLRKTLKEYDSNYYWNIDELINEEPEDFLYLLDVFLYDAKQAGLKL